MSDVRYEIEEFLSKVSGNPMSEVHRMCDYDYRMNASKAISLGFADRVMK